VKQRFSSLLHAPGVRLLAAAVLVAVVSFVVGRVSLDYFKVPGVATSVWWPATGMVLAIVMRCPRRWWWVLLAVFGAMNGLADLPLRSAPVIVTYALVNVLEVLVAALVLRPTTGRRERGLRTPQDAVRLMVAVAAAVGAGAVFVAASGAVIPGDASWHVITRGYVAAHTLGLFAMAPLLLPGQVWWRSTVVRHIEFVVVLTAGIVIDTWVFLQPLAGGRAFPVLLPIVWAAIRLDPVRATIVALLGCSLAAYSTSRGLGTFAAVSDPADRQLVTQLLIATVVITTLALVLITRHRAQLAAEANDSEQTLQIAIREALVGIYSVRLDPGRVGEIRDVNTAMVRMLGYQPEELIGRRDEVFRMSSDGSGPTAVDDQLQQLADGDINAFQRETRLAAKNGAELWVEMSAARLTPATSEPFALIYVHDLTGSEQNKRMLEAMALHDALTGLPNRAVLFPRLEEYLHHARRDGTRVGLLYLDLDGFKPVNDTHGHAAGDSVLVEVARRLERTVRPGDTVARLGGDEFAVLAADIAGDQDLAALADRIHDGLSQPIELPDGEVITIGSSIGAAVASHDMTADELVRAADIAMYRIKHSGRPVRLDGRRATGK
jgi:diguanylate cyclase (GGDEF)-like protein/PAS domain S-box-containing protein